MPTIPNRRISITVQRGDKPSVSVKQTNSTVTLKQAGRPGPQGEKGEKGDRGLRGERGHAADPAAILALDARVTATEQQLSGRPFFQGSMNGANPATTVLGFRGVPLIADTDPDNAWDGISYLVPETGIYQIVAKIRYADGLPKYDFGVGADTDWVDSASFLWSQLNDFRNGSCNVITRHLTAGQRLYLISYTDTPLQPIAASLTLFKL